MNDKPRQVQYKAGSTFVPAIQQKRELAPIQVSSPSIIDLLPTAGATAHARSNDDAVTNAKGALLISAAYVIAAGMITAGLLLIVWLFRGLGDGWATYTFTGLIAWGVCILGALWGNRRQSLHHSATAPQELLITRFLPERRLQCTRWTCTPLCCYVDGRATRNERSPIG